MPDDGILFESVVFRQRSVEISFTEEQDRGDGIVLIKTFSIANDRLPQHLADLHDSLRELADEAAVQLRNPPPRIGGRDAE